ncbi:Predicted transcriptional regulator YheO, contains PAS and DNA-binding HTH domains [Dethiosulfatibacter aminovorans DSM 17477]|uniref:Predicted transcriptional regulator YheO, contains PAS and DNA-binding HTH domains n=1 Tax=Dethiosulfatibacter aminovorans DSM 17477 TaxID=1121476 RepID=A0A1M6C233_9FIRM|nr:PAS domain-containing protein [Dethiosulfatibacter aminovorans]SHI55002.1 Predicted transcriptional regulator YheO, contains PAS and DNA-binding HTH domains [Dethiosulfatibacter aminovorans DSM 17477]
MEKLLIQFANFMSRVQGPSTEITLHNFRTGEILFLKHGYVTGRQPDYKNNSETLERIKELAENNQDYLVGYRRISSNDQPLRSSNMFIRDENGELAYVLCVNQNIKELEQFQNFLSYFTTSCIPLESTATNKEETIESLIDNIISDEIEKIKHSGLDIMTKEVRFDIINRLDKKGVFDVKGSVQKVCEVLNISQATMYNYLKEIHRD